MYKRYSVNNISLGKGIDSFLYGIISASTLVLFNPFIDRILPQGNEFIIALIHASLLEKIAAFITIFIILNYIHNHTNITESITIGLFFGLGFSALENVFYAYEIQRTEVLLRLFSSVPLHLTTCGILGYFLGMHTLYGYKWRKVLMLVLALLIPGFLHAIYDFTLLLGSAYTYIIAPELVFLIGYNEFLMAKSLSIPSIKELKLKKIDLEDYEIIHRQLEYERWIHKSSGRKDNQIVPFFRLENLNAKKYYIFLLLGFSLISLFLMDWINAHYIIYLKPEEQITLFILYPLVGACNFLLVGSINPDYFKSSVLRLPIIGTISMWIDDEEYITDGSDFTPYNTFIKTIETIDVGKEIDFIYVYSAEISSTVRAKVIWDNHENLFEPIGTLVRITEQKNYKYLWYILNYNIYRFTRGIIFNLKIPGFKILRNHFVKEITMLKEHSYYTEGTILFHEGDQGNHFYFVKQGVIEIYKTSSDGKKIILSYIEPGNIFGEMSMITGLPRAATAICLTNSLLATSDAANLEALIWNNQQFSFKLLQTLANRLSSSEGKLMSRISELEQLNKAQEEKILLLDTILTEVFENDKEGLKKRKTEVAQRKKAGKKSNPKVKSKKKKTTSSKKKV